MGRRRRRRTSVKLLVAWCHGGELKLMGRRRGRRASVKLLVAWCHGGESATTALRRRLSTGKDKAPKRVPHRFHS
ncbi:hypothetical protein TB2_025014 [Malus domestica]